jgi:hypothetical protein
MSALRHKRIYLCGVSFIQKLQDRWKVDSPIKVILILTVFALTGSTVVYIKGYVKPYFQDYWWFDLLYYVAILPVYNLILLIYGFIFGQFSYFWEFEKRFFARIFKRNSKNS